MNNFPFTNENMAWYETMINAYHNLLSDGQKQALAEWEKNNLGVSEKSTSDWPGWIDLIGPPPWKVRNN